MFRTGVIKIFVIILLRSFSVEHVAAKNTKSILVNGGTSYLFVTDNELNWFDAAHYCRRLGSDLVSIESAHELRLIDNHLSTRFNTKGPHVYWTSGNNLGDHESFKWLGTGKPMHFTRWGYGQPDNLRNHNCVAIWRECESKYKNEFACAKDLKCAELMPSCLRYKMDDKNCEKTAAFICKYVENQRL